MEKGLVSVVIPNYNYAHHLREAIDSALAQSYPDVEIIVVDDGSTDGSKDLLDQYKGKITAIFQKNQGVSAARNKGAALSQGEYLAFLDADDVWLPAKVERQIEFFRADPTLGLVHVGVREVDGAGRTLLDRLEGLEGKVSDDLLMLKREGILGGGSGLMVPRYVFDEVGGFDLRLSTSADWDFFYQVSTRYLVGFVPQILLEYRVHHSNMHGNVAAMEHDMVLAFKKAFENGPASRACYGNLYKTLAGSYFRIGNYGDFIRSAVRSLRYQPANLGYFLTYPFRRLKAR